MDTYGNNNVTGSDFLNLAMYMPGASRKRLSPSDEQLYGGKWIIHSSGTFMHPFSCGKFYNETAPYCQVLAVCESGCPDGIAPSPFPTMLWPAAGNFQMNWTLLGHSTPPLLSDTTSAQATGFCCPKVRSKCDACDDRKTCGADSFIHYFLGCKKSPLAQECCSDSWDPVFGPSFHECRCYPPEDFCAPPTTSEGDVGKNGWLTI